MKNENADPKHDKHSHEKHSHHLSRRSALKTMAAVSLLGVPARDPSDARLSPNRLRQLRPYAEQSIEIAPSGPLADAIRICAKVYPANRRKDLLSFTNKTGYRMTVSPNGFPVAICMCPDLTFGMLGSRFMRSRVYLDTFRGHMDFLPRNMRRNGRFFINEDMMAGADRVFSQVMYPLWIWEIYRATADMALLKFHQEPLMRCLNYIESRTDDRGIVTQVDPDDWQYSEGADWVDWCPERMEGSTCVYHTWYVRALEGCVQIFRILNNDAAMRVCRERLDRQREALNKHFWNGKAYWDNINFQGEPVGRFWCDSQIWPIAYGYAAPDQAASIFARIDAEPELFEGAPMRWCAPIAPGDEDPRYSPGGKYGDTPRPELREFSWFGRLGAGDILARYQCGQSSHALRLIMRYADIVSHLHTVPECIDMHGNPKHGTGGAGDYLEHAGGYLWCLGKGMFGIDDAPQGNLIWAPRIPSEIREARVPFWHGGNCWEFGCDEKVLWIDPKGASGEVLFQSKNESNLISIKEKRVEFARHV